VLFFVESHDPLCTKELDLREPFLVVIVTPACDELSPSGERPSGFWIPDSGFLL
jgi:hypothetical protein